MGLATGGRRASEEVISGRSETARVRWVSGDSSRRNHSAPLVSAYETNRRTDRRTRPSNLTPPGPARRSGHADLAGGGAARPTSQAAMGKYLGIWFLWSKVIALIAAYLAPLGIKKSGGLTQGSETATLARASDPRARTGILATTGKAVEWVTRDLQLRRSPDLAGSARAGGDHFLLLAAFWNVWARWWRARMRCSGLIRPARRMVSSVESAAAMSAAE